MSEAPTPAPEAEAPPVVEAPPAPAAPAEVPAEPVEGQDPPVAPETPVAPAGADSEAASASAIDPAAYEFTFPDTFTPDEVFLTDARAKMAEAGVPKDKAQGLVDLYVSAQTAAQTAANTAFEATNTAWLAEVNALPDFQGPTREKSLALIGRVFDEHGVDAKEAFTNPLIGNNPSVVKFMLSVAKALSEGSPTPPGGVPPGGGKPAPKGFHLTYPNTPDN